MIIYVTKDFYLDNYGSKFIPEDLIEIFLKKAQNEVENYCANGIRRVLFRYVGEKELDNYKTLDELQADKDVLCDFEIELLREAICETANFLYENNDVLNGVVTSMSANGASVTISKSDVDITKNYIISKSLEMTRFTNAII